MVADTRANGRSPRFLALYALANAGGVFAFLPLLTLLLPLKVEAMAGADRLGLLTLATLGGAVAASVSNIVFGALSDRTHARIGTRRRWIAAGLLATIASYGAILLAATPVTLVGSVVAYQAALNMMLGPLFATMADEVPDDAKGLAGGLLSIASPFGSIAGGLLLAAHGLGEAGRFAVVCAAVAAMVAPLLVFAPVGGVPAEPPPPATRAIRRLDLGFVWFARLLLQVAANVLFTYLLFFFESVAPSRDPLALGSWVGHVTGMAFLLSVPLALVVGRWSDRSGRRKPFLLAAALVTASGLATMAATRGLALAVLGFGLFACGSAVFFGLHSAYAMQILPSPEHRGRDLGVLNLTNTLPAVLGPALTWALATSESFQSVLLTLAGLSVLGGLLVLPVRTQG